MLPPTLQRMLRALRLEVHASIAESIQAEVERALQEAVTGAWVPVTTGLPKDNGSRYGTPVLVLVDGPIIRTQTAHYLAAKGPNRRWVQIGGGYHNPRRIIAWRELPVCDLPNPAWHGRVAVTTNSVPEGAT